MRKFFLFLISIFIGICLFVLIGKEVGWDKIGAAFRLFSLKTGFIILVLTILAVLVRSWRWKTILKSQGYDVPALRVVEYYLSGNAITFFMPMVIFGGEIFRGHDLKEKYSIPWPKSIASVIIDRILELTIYSLTIILGVVFFLRQAAFPSDRIAIIVFSFIFLIIFLVGFFYFKSFKKESITLFFLRKFNLKNSNGADTVIDAEKEIFKYFRFNKKIMWEGIILSVLAQLILITRTILLISFLGKSIGVPSAISVVGFSSLAFILPIPAALGSHEAVQSFVFNSLGLGASTGMAFVFIIRGAELILALIGAVFFCKFGIQILESVIFKKMKKIISRQKD